MNSTIPTITTSIVIPTCNNYEGFKKCIDSVIKYTDLNDKEIIVVLNEDIDTPERILIYNYSYNVNNRLLVMTDPLNEIGGNKIIVLLDIKQRVGYAKAANLGISESKGEYIVLLNDDTILLEQKVDDWINILKQPFIDNANTGITAPMKAYSPPANSTFLIFFCVMISKKVINTISVLDEIFYSYGEDIDYCIKAEKAGFIVTQVCPTDEIKDNRMVGHFPIYHEGGATHMNVEGLDDLIKKNNKILNDRYVKNINQLSPQVELNKEELPPITLYPKLEDDTIDIEKAKTIEGYMLDQELEWLARVATTAKVFIELGSLYGRSSNAIASNLPIDGILFCIDTWGGSPTEQVLMTEANKMQGDKAFYRFIKNNQEHIMSGKIVPLRMKGEHAFNLLREMGVKADVVFIDAEHTYDAVRRDVINGYSIVKDGGIICGHDYAPDWESVRKAVDDNVSDFNVVPFTSIWHKIAGQ
jgi:glycosyltransferase involved in cell wall biosynthesis